MRDVATRARVSTATVSNVLRGRRAVDPVLVERVTRAANELDYQIDRAASLLRAGRAAVVAVVVPSLDNPFFTGLIAAIERSVQAESHDVIVASANNSDLVERARIAAMLSWKPAGLIVVPCSDGFPARDLIDFSGIPCVVVDRVAGIDGLSSVTIDNEKAAGQAAEHLLALGHRDILICASSLKLANIRERCAGAGAAFARAGRPAPPVLEVGLEFEEARHTLDHHLARHGRPTGIIALTNTATLGVLAACRDLGLAVPDNLSLVGFDDYAWMAASTPPITAVRQPVDVMGAAAWEQLRCMIARPEENAARLVLGCRLEVRQSTRPINPPP
jgi:LacI family transcriptional regulator